MPARGAMMQPADRETCVQCGASAPVRAVAARLARCDACGAIVAQFSSEKELTGRAAAVRLDIAPDGVLRGKYRLIERLGEGAHGVSFLAVHAFLRHLCVVKVLSVRGGEAAEPAMQRLRREARAGFRVSDPHVVRVLDCDVVRGSWYFVMEHVPGVDLSAVIRQGLTMTWAQAAQVGVAAARGLAAIHRCGLIHRDVKPGNLILGVDGAVRVADLGVAELAHERTPGPAGTPGIAGTLAYTAPESLLVDGSAGPAIDLYSLGATLFHLVTGRLPHGDDRVFRRLVDQQSREVVWPEEHAGVPNWFRSAVLRLLAIDPDRRFESALAAADALSAAAQGPAERASVPTVQPLEPRGIGVLPFENDTAASGDDWLGYAVAHHLSRVLATIPGVFVADQDSLAALVERMERGRPGPGRERLLTAGRMAGAGIVVTGRFRRSGERLQVALEVCRLGRAGADSVPPVEGALEDLPALERELLARLTGVLGLPTPPAGAAAPSPAAVLGAREKLVLARQAFLAGRYSEAIALGEAAERLDAEAIDAIGLVGVCHARTGAYEQAEARHRQQHALAVARGDARLQVEALANLGVMNYFRGDYETAQGHYEQAAALAAGAGLAVEEAQIRNNLGFVLFRRGLLDRAAEAFRRAIETHRAYGALTSLIGPSSGMGNVLVEQGRHADAGEYYRLALEVAEEVDDRTSVGTTHMHLGRCAALQQRFADAKHEFTMALSTLEETRFWNGLARAYEYMAELNQQLGDWDEAIRCADKRIELARQHANARLEAAAWLQKAESLRRAGRAAEADACEAHGRGVLADGPRSS